MSFRTSASEQKGISVSASRHLRIAPSLRRNLALTALAAFCVLGLLASSASAAISHEFTGVTIGPSGTGSNNEFNDIQSIATDPANGDIYIFEGDTQNLYKFNSAGEEKDFSALGTNAINSPGIRNGETQVAIAPPGSPGGTAGDIYVATAFQLEIFAPSGQHLGRLEDGTTCGVATNEVGHVFLGLRGGVVAEYTPTSNPLTSADRTGATTEPLRAPCNLAISSDGTIYVDGRTEEPPHGAFALEGLNDPTPTLIDADAKQLALDPTSNDLYVTTESVVRQYTSTGTPLGSFGGNDLKEPFGIAVNPFTESIYVGNNSLGRVMVFSATPTTVPDVTTGEATVVSPNHVTLHGTVNAAGAGPASCRFEYVQFYPSYYEHGFANATTVPCTSGPFSGSGDHSVEAPATVLPNESYEYRLVSEGANGTGYGDPKRFETPRALSVQILGVTNLTAHGAQLNGAVNPEGSPVEECVFEIFAGGFNFGAHPSAEIPCAESSGEIGSGTEPVEVHAQISGLQLGSFYGVGLRAGNQFGTTQGGFEGFQTSGARISTYSVAPVETSATFSAGINPEGEGVAYAFEYVSNVAYEESEFSTATSVPLGGGTLPAVEEELTAQAEATGLAPGTGYRFRVKIETAAGTAYTQAQRFSTYAPNSIALPDGRQYEQVTPTNKNATSIVGSDFNVFATSPDGSATTYGTVVGVGNDESLQAAPSYIARRGATGWVSQGALPSPVFGEKQRATSWTKDLSGAYSIAYFAGGTGSLVRKEANGETVVLAEKLPAGTAEQTYVAAESADGSHVLFESPASLAAGAVAGKSNVYLWSEATEENKLVSVLSSGSSPSQGAFAGAYQWIPHSRKSSNRFAGGPKFIYASNTALSADGSVAVFTTAGANQIYARLNPLSAGAETVHVSASQKTNGTGPGGTDPHGPDSAVYLASTPDGRYVFFASGEELTNDAYTGTAGQGEDIYRYDTDSGELVDLSPHQAGIGANVSGIAGVSEDGSYVYFGAKAALAVGAEDGAENFYVWRDGTVKFISVVTRENFQHSIYEGGFLPKKPARVTPDGRTIIFSAQRSEPGFSTGVNAQVYRFEYGQAEPTCISCNTTRETAESPAALGGVPTREENPQVEVVNLAHNLSDDGKRVFFQTREPLVHRDTNGKTDVYEWEADGAGSCSSTGFGGGCVYLISTGTSPESSYFTGASDNGDDAFFLTHQQLVSQDKDEFSDVYDASVSHPLAAQQNQVPPPACVGEACREAAAGTTPARAAGTSTFVGPGNPEQKKHPHKKSKHKHKKSKHKKKKKHTRHRSGNARVNLKEGR